MVETILTAFVILLLVAVGWVANDAARRNRSWFGWAFLVANTSILGLILWLIVRRGSPARAVRLSPLKRGLLWFAAVPVGLLNVVIGTCRPRVSRAGRSHRGAGHGANAQQPGPADRRQPVYRIRAPERGDIVTHRYPRDPEKAFVKRVIAKEGDTIRSVDGRVDVNDVALDDAYVLNEFRSHDSWGPQVLPQGYYFVMGDHRNNSSDSRHWGLVPTDYIEGKVTVRWWPINDAKIF